MYSNCTIAGLRLLQEVLGGTGYMLPVRAQQRACAFVQHGRIRSDSHLRGSTVPTISAASAASVTRSLRQALATC